MKCKTCGTDHRGVAKHGGYCLDHQELRAEAAEVAVAESAAFARGLQNELKAAEAHAADEELRAKSWHDSAMTLADQRDAAYKRNEELEARSADAENHNTNLLREVEQWRIHVDHVEAERDEARRQLTEAQHAIDVLSNTVVAQNNEIKRLRQKREDVEQYRDEIERLHQAATA